MDESRSSRRATNEVVFRLVNEEIEALNIDVQGSTAAGSMDIVCECEDIACAERLAVTIDAYEDVRASPLLFFVHPATSAKTSNRSSRPPSPTTWSPRTLEAPAAKPQ